jgi:hypothetical protein
MRLVYKATQAEVKIGDIVDLRPGKRKVVSFRPPHKPASEGKITVAIPAKPPFDQQEYYVSVIGAEWIEREDRQE